MNWWWRSRQVTWDLPSGWPTPVPVPVLLAVALLTAPSIAAYRYRHVWTPLQRRYLWTYVRSGTAFTSSGPYDLLQLVDRTGSRLALDHDVVVVTVGDDDAVFVLAQDAEQAGATHLAWQDGRYSHTAVQALLRRAIYRDQTLLDLASPAVWGALALFVGGVIGAIAQDVILARASRTFRRFSSGGWGVPMPANIVTVSPSVERGEALPPPRPTLPASSRRLADDTVASPDAPGPRASSSLGPPAAWYQRLFK